MNDINDVKLEIGDKVIYTHASNGYLRKGEIIKFTKEGASIKHETVNWNNKIGPGFTENNYGKKDVITNLRGMQQRVMKLDN